MSLARKTTSGFFWTAGNQFGLQLINFLVLVVLSRVLTPEAFGLVAMLQVFVAIGTSLIDGGMTSSLIRTTNADQKDYSTVFFINLASSVLIYAILFFCAPLIARFYEQPMLSSLVRVYGLSFIIQALVAVQTTRLVKAMNFRLQLLMQMPATIIGAVAGIIFAFQGHGVWSLVYMNLIKTFAFMIQHWMFTNWRPSLLIDRKKLRHHFSFGYKLTLIGLLNTVYLNIYNLLIGKFFTPVQVGYYNQANTFSLLPVDMFSTALDKVTYPVFANIQSDDSRLRAVYRRIMQQVVYWTVPLTMFMIVAAEPLIRIVLTEQWLPAVPYFQILCIYAMMHPLQVYNINILKVKGRSDLMLKLELIKKIVGIAGAFAIGFWGLEPLLWFKAGYAFFLFYMNTRFSGRMIGYGMRDQLRDIYPMFSLGLLIFLCCWGFDQWVLRPAGVNDWVLVIADGLLFFILYMTASYFTRVSALTDFTEVILKHKKISTLLTGSGKG